jgi:hypothetical protein
MKRPEISHVISQLIKLITEVNTGSDFCCELSTKMCPRTRQARNIRYGSYQSVNFVQVFLFAFYGMSHVASRYKEKARFWRDFQGRHLVRADRP